MKFSEKEVLCRSVGSRITKLRENKELSVQELAYKCDIERSNLSRIEGGRTNPTIWTLNKIADALGVDLKDLFEFQ